jgi:hypothetical protein
MLNVKIISYNARFKTFHISVQEQTPDVPEPIESLIPEILLPYIAPELVAQLGGYDLPYELIGQEFNLTLPVSSS